MYMRLDAREKRLSAARLPPSGTAAAILEWIGWMWSWRRQRRHRGIGRNRSGLLNRSRSAVLCPNASRFATGVTSGPRTHHPALPWLAPTLLRPALLIGRYAPSSMHLQRPVSCRASSKFVVYRNGSSSQAARSAHS